MFSLLWNISVFNLLLKTAGTELRSLHSFSLGPVLFLCLLNVSSSLLKNSHLCG